jgi:hypothetical protein
MPGVGRLLKHEVGNVGPRDSETTILADVADAVLALLLPFSEHRPVHDDLVETAALDDGLRAATPGGDARTV